LCVCLSGNFNIMSWLYAITNCLRHLCMFSLSLCLFECLFACPLVFPEISTVVSKSFSNGFLSARRSSIPTLSEPLPVRFLFFVCVYLSLFVSVRVSVCMFLSVYACVCLYVYDRMFYSVAKSRKILSPFYTLLNLSGGKRGLDIGSRRRIRIRSLKQNPRDGNDTNCFEKNKILYLAV